MDKLLDAVMRNLPKACPAASLALFTREFVEEQLENMFPVLETPDHPPYSLMIQQAINKLKEEGGSNKDSISKCIASDYDRLSWAHDSLLSHHLRKLCDRGEIVRTSDDRYVLPSFDGEGSVLPVSTTDKCKRGRGKKRGMHVQNKKSKRESSPEDRNLEAELNMKQPRTEMEGLQESELATKGSSPVKGNEQESLSQGPQYESTREADQAAESINVEPAVELVQVSGVRDTATGQMPMQQDVLVADHDESDEQHIQLHDVIMAQRDPVDALTVTVEDTEQSLADSESRSRTVEEPPQQIHVDDFPMRCASTGNRSKVVEGSSVKSQSPELIFRQILILQKQLRDSAIRLKQLDEAPGNDGTLPREHVVEVYRRNREIGFIFQEMLENSPESLSGLLNHTTHEGKASVPSRDLPTIGDGAAGVRFPLLRCQKQDRSPLFMDSCPGIPDDAAKNSGDLSRGVQKQPELPNEQTHMCMVGLPVLGRPEKATKPPQPDHRVGQLEGTQSCALPPQGQVLGLNGGINEVPPSVFIGEQACPDEPALQCDHHLELGFDLSKSHDGREGDANNSSFSAQQIEKYPAVSDEHEDPIYGRPMAEPPDKPSELPIPEGSKELSQMESQQAATEPMTKTRDDVFSPEVESDFARRIPEQPHRNELERDNTITIASSNPDPPAASTSTDQSIREKKRYNTNIEYREKLRSPAIPPETIRTTGGPTPDNSSQYPVPTEGTGTPPVQKKRRGRPRKVTLPD